MGRKCRSTFGVATLALALVASHAADAGHGRAPRLPRPSKPLVEGGHANPIKAWTEFCARTPSECASPPSEPESIVLTRGTWAMVRRVNAEVNAEIVPMTDMANLGVEDRWDIPDSGTGDCEDFQLLKRRRLAEAGIPRRAMRMTVVIDETNQGHAVLMLRTDRGDVVLDNKTREVLPWADTGYTFVKRESAEAGLWVSLGGASAQPTVTANR